MRFPKYLCFGVVSHCPIKHSDCEVVVSSQILRGDSLQPVNKKKIFQTLIKNSRYPIISSVVSTSAAERSVASPSALRLLAYLTKYGFHSPCAYNSTTLLLSQPTAVGAVTYRRPRFFVGCTTNAFVKYLIAFWVFTSCLKSSLLYLAM